MPFIKTSIKIIKYPTNKGSLPIGYIKHIELSMELGLPLFNIKFYHRIGDGLLSHPLVWKVTSPLQKNFTSVSVSQEVDVRNLSNQELQ